MQQGKAAISDAIVPQAASPFVYDCIILGAGAAGLYCALHAARRGRRVLVLEGNPEPGRKILISGGGRCNFTNIHTAADRFVSANSAFARSALARHGPDAFIDLVKRHKIAFYEKTLGQLFCEGPRSAELIVRMLLEECAAGDVTLKTSVRIDAVSKGEHFSVETDRGSFEAPALVVASGGLSIPKLGATDLAYRLARQFDLPVIEPRPGLVPLTVEGAARMTDLTGVSTQALVQAGKARFREAVLFTHRGLSGPAVLQASSYWRSGEPIVIDWAPDKTEDFLVTAKRERPRALVKTALAAVTPARLADALSAQLPQGALADLKDSTLVEAGARVKAWSVTPSGTEGYAKAEVTVGGVDTAALSQQTMEARLVPGLFVIGEAADVTGWLGGYNFQWAWSSAWCAAQAI
jgi:predicted Rossmann fold flavoprotein